MKPPDAQSLVALVRKYFSSPVSFYNEAPRDDAGRLVYATIKGVEEANDPSRPRLRIFFTLSARQPQDDNWKSHRDPVERVEALGRGSGSDPDLYTSLPLSFTFRGSSRFDEDHVAFRRFVGDASRALRDLEILDPRVRDLRRPNELEQENVLQALGWLEDPDGPAKSPLALTSTLDGTPYPKGTSPYCLAGTAKSAEIAADRLVKQDVVIRRHRSLFEAVARELNHLAGVIESATKKVDPADRQRAATAKEHLKLITQVD